MPIYEQPTYGPSLFDTTPSPTRLGVPSVQDYLATYQERNERFLRPVRSPMAWGSVPSVETVPDVTSIADSDTDSRIQFGGFYDGISDDASGGYSGGSLGGIPSVDSALNDFAGSIDQTLTGYGEDVSAFASDPLGTIGDSINEFGEDISDTITGFGDDVTSFGNDPLGSLADTDDSTAISTGGVIGSGLLGPVGSIMGQALGGLATQAPVSVTAGSVIGSLAGNLLGGPILGVPFGFFGRNIGENMAMQDTLGMTGLGFGTNLGHTFGLISTPDAMRGYYGIDTPGNDPFGANDSRGPEGSVSFVDDIGDIDPASGLGWGSFDPGVGGGSGSGGGAFGTGSHPGER
jgi:hypothetical protein